MNILNKVTWKAMWKNRTRTLVTIVGIILSAALFCTVTTMGTSILSYLIDLQISVSGDYHVSATVVSKENAERIRTQEGVASVAQAEILGVVNLYGYEMGLNSAMVKACNNQYFTSMPGFDNIDGRLPQNSSELVIGEYLLHTMEAKGYAIAVGSEVSLHVTPVVESMGKGNPSASDFTITGTIVGILPVEYDIILSHEKGTYSHIYMGMDENTPAPLYVDLFLKASSPYRALDLAEAIDGEPNYSLLQYYGTAKAGKVTILIFVIMVAIISIVLIGTVSMVSTAFSISVSQRTQEFGLLSSVGATKKQIRNCIHFEAGLLCLVSVPLGLLIGFILAKVLLASSADTVESMLAVSRTGVELKTVVNPAALLVATAIATVAVFLSAWIPALRASQITPIAAIRREIEYRPDRKLQKMARKWWNPSRICRNMAHKYYCVNRKKYRPIVVALGISVILFLSATAVSSSLQFVSNSFNTENCDFHVFILNNDESLLEEIRGHESVAESVLYRNDRFYAIIPEEFESQQRQNVFNEEEMENHPMENVWRSNAASIYYLEDTAFQAFLQKQGVDPDPYFDQETSLAVVLYQKWECVGMNENGDYDWIWVTFPPFHDGVTDISLVSEAPDVEEYVAAQIRMQGYQEVLLSEQEFDILTDGRIVFRVYAQGCSIESQGGGLSGICPEGPIRTFTFLAVENVDDENQPITRYYTYDEESGALGSAVIAEIYDGMDTIKIGTQAKGVPFGLPSVADSASQLTVIKPLSMAEDFYDLPVLSIRTNNYPATKSYLDSLAEDGSVLLYNDYLAEQYQTRQVSNLIELFAVTFVAVMTLISVANIFNIVSTNILLRRWDIGMLRSIGMSKRNVISMTVHEYISCGIYSLSWSLPVGLLLMGSGKILLANMINGGREIQWWAIWAAIAGVFVVVGSGVCYALIRIHENNPIEAIRTENI